MKLYQILFSIIAFAMFAGCGGGATTVTDVPAVVESNKPEIGLPLQLSESEFPRIDGSTATIPLGEAVVSAITGLDRDQSSALVNFSGTSEAYVNLAYGDVDFLLVYEMPDAAMAENPRVKNAEFESVSIGRDALVFIINSQNPVDKLTTEQIQDIYSGKITNWNEVDGPDAEIAAFQRNKSAGSQALMEKLVMKDIPLEIAQETFITYGSMMGMNSAIASYDSGKFSIGYNVFYYVKNMKADDRIKMLAVDGVTPSNETIANGDYPFVNDFYAVIRKDAPVGSPERKLFEWIQGKEGHALIAEEGYVPIEAD